MQCIHTPDEKERGRKTPQFSHPSSWNWSDTFLRIFTNIFIPFTIAALRKESLSGKRCATGILTTTLLAIRAMAMQITTKWKSLYEGDFFCNQLDKMSKVLCWKDERTHYEFFLDKTA